MNFIPLSISDLMAMTIGANSIYNISIAILIMIGTFLFLRLFRGVILMRIKKLAARTDNTFDDAFIEIVENISSFFYWGLALYISIQWLIIPGLAVKIIQTILIILVIYEITKISCVFLKYTKEKNEEEADSTALSGLKLIIRIVLWSIGILVILSNFGINITTLVTGMGIGGVAIAFAAQSILGDLFSSFSIYFDKPFRIGDFIIVGTDSGNVQKIGLKSTRIKTLQGEELIISNKELTTVRVQNFKPLERRRVVLRFGVSYDTSAKTLSQIPALIQEIISAEAFGEPVRVVLVDLLNGNFNFEVIFFVNSSEYEIFAQMQHRIIIGIKEVFEKKSIELSAPAQNVYLQNTSDKN
jgi:small-conductance mechanosensitive channel